MLDPLNMIRCADHIRRLTCWPAPVAMLMLQKNLHLLTGKRADDEHD